MVARNLPSITELGSQAAGEAAAPTMGASLAAIPILETIGALAEKYTGYIDKKSLAKKNVAKLESNYRKDYESKSNSLSTANSE